MILLKSNPESLNIVIEALKENKIVIIPTDTVYGFSGIVPQTDSLIRRIKGRDEVKPFIQLISHPDDLKMYSNTAIPPEVSKHMPGPLTVIVKNKDNEGTTAFRCPDDVWLQTVIKACKAPLYSTSTNRSGQAILSDIQEMEEEFGSEVHCIIDGKLDISKNTLPSTIVDVSNDEIKVIRQGEVKIESLNDTI